MSERLAAHGAIAAGDQLDLGLDPRLGERGRNLVGNFAIGRDRPAAAIE